MSIDAYNPNTFEGFLKCRLSSDLYGNWAAFNNVLFDLLIERIAKEADEFFGDADLVDQLKTQNEELKKLVAILQMTLERKQLRP